MPRRPRYEDLPQAHQLVLGILVEAGEITWPELARRAAAVGISEEELVQVMGVDGRRDAERAR